MMDYWEDYICVCCHDVFPSNVGDPLNEHNLCEKCAESLWDDENDNEIPEYPITDEEEEN